MKRNLRLNILTALLMLLALADARAQPLFAYTAALKPVTEGGFYKIALTPSIIARCRNGLNDIRILDDKDIQVPYIMKADPAQFHESNFREFPVLSVSKETDRQTHIVIRNPVNRPVGGLLLVIKNTDANRNVNISGSDDRKQWFIIKENIPLDNFFSTGDDRFVQSLGFPESRYAYFKIIINGKDLLPVNIVKAGVYTDSAYQGNYMPVPAPAITQTDSSNKASYINLLFSDSYQIDKLEVTVKGPKFYKRSFSLMAETGSASVTTESMLRSDARASFPVEVKARKLTMVIQNEDSPPLTISSAVALQRSRYLLTYFEPGGKYRLVFGDSTTAAPRYDLEFFKDSIGKHPAALTAGAVVRNGLTAKAPEAAVSTRQTAMLWIIIAAVLGLLLALTLQMTKEVKKKTEQ